MAASLAPPQTLFRRELPPPAWALTSAPGREAIRRADAAGYAGAFFRALEAHQTQNEPAFCGLASLATALNTLRVDPGRAWKGPWRWYDERQLVCCKPLEVVEKEGVTLGELTCLARCTGASVTVKRPSDAGVTLGTFLDDVRRTCSEDSDELLIASYSRRALGQTGDGHFAVLGAYDEYTNGVLILETARFKYPMHFVPAEQLFEAMRWEDSATGRERGYMLVRADQAAADSAAAAPFTLSLRPLAEGADPCASRALALQIVDELGRPEGQGGDWADWALAKCGAIAELGLVTDGNATGAEAGDGNGAAGSVVGEEAGAPAGEPDCGCDSMAGVAHASRPIGGGFASCSTRSAIAGMPGTPVLRARARGVDGKLSERAVALLLAACRVARTVAGQGDSGALRLDAVEAGLGDARRDARVEAVVRHLARQLEEVYRAEDELRGAHGQLASTSIV